MISALALVLSVLESRDFKAEIRAERQQIKNERLAATKIIDLPGAVLARRFQERSFQQKFKELGKSQRAHWVEDELVGPLKGLGVQYGWTFNTRAELTYRSEQAGKDKISVSGPQILAALRRNPRQADFYLKSPIGPVHYWATPIPGSGIAVIGQLCSPSFAQSLGSMTGAKVKVNNDLNPESLRSVFEWPLRDHRGRAIAFIEFQFPHSSAEEITTGFLPAWAGIPIAATLIALFFGVLMVRWVQRPISLLVRAMTNDEPHILDELATERTDMGELAKLVQNSAIQSLRIAAINKELERRMTEFNNSYDMMIQGWSRAMDMRDHETEGHTQRVAQMSMMLATKLGLDDELKTRLYRGALLHDIGKMGVPDAILLKPGKLTDEEFDIMKKHCQYAVEMLEPITFVKDCLDVPHYHHEKYDGTGYPCQLAGEHIPLLARIFAVADVWDALRSDRPYRKGWTETETRAYIAEQAGRHFDPAIVDAFLELEAMPHPTDAICEDAA